MNSLYRFTIATILALSLTFLIGCSSDDDDNPTGPSTTNSFTEAAEIGDAYLTAGTKNITAADLYADIQAGTNLFMIDFRSADHFANRGHIEGAVNWTIGSLPDNVGQIPSGAKVICICYSGQTASHATAYLNMMDYNAYNLKWGMCAWTTDETVNPPTSAWYGLVPGGQATEPTAHSLTTEYEFPSLDCEAVEVCVHDNCNAFFDSGLKYISAADLYLNLNDGDTSNDPFLLSYWNETSYNGGHIPGSFRFEPGSLGPDELLEYVPTNKQIVVWCYTGQTSAQVSTYLNMLGYNAYSLSFGMNAINPALCGTSIFHAPTTDYPVVMGTAA